MSNGLNEIKTKLVENFINGEILSKSYTDLKYQKEYVSDYNMNLYREMPSTIVKQFEEGDGDELHDKKEDPAKMKAKYSSSAFAVNLFGYDKVKIVTNSYGIPEGEYDVAYENQLETLRGTKKANVDVHIFNKECEIFVEMKLLEPIREEKQECKVSYTHEDKYILNNGTVRQEFIKLFERYGDNKNHQYDVQQMLKHLLGICNTMDKRQGKKVFLINCHCANAILDDANSDFQVMGDNYIKDVAKICDACGVKVMNLNHKEMMAIMDIEEGRRKYVEARYNLE